MVIYVIRHVLKIDKACLPLTPPVPLCLPQSEGGEKRVSGDHPPLGGV